MEVIAYIGDTESFVSLDSKRKPVRVTSRDMATIFANNDADKFIQNSVPKNKRKNLIIQHFKSKELFLKGIDEIDGMYYKDNILVNDVSKYIKTKEETKIEFKSKKDEIKVPDLIEENTLNKDKSSDFKDIIDMLESNSENMNIDELENNWVNFLKSSDKFIDSIKSNSHDLTNELNKVEDELLDLRHFIEFNKFGVVQAYKTLMFFKKKLQYRRKIKNTIDILTIIRRDWFSRLQSVNVYKAIKNRDSKKYTPRVLFELFNNDKKHYN